MVGSLTLLLSMEMPTESMRQAQTSVKYKRLFNCLAFQPLSEEPNRIVPISVYHVDICNS